jgi:hypothetical protein
MVVQGHAPHEFTGQKAEILKLLRKHRGEWVPVYRLAALSLQYNARLYEIRASGVVVESKTERIDGRVHGSFRLVSEPGDEPEQLELVPPADPEVPHA